MFAPDWSLEARDAQLSEEHLQRFLVVLIKDGKAWQRRTLVTVIRTGGIRQTPPLLPLRSFACSFSVYSTIPYGGSVTMACSDFSLTDASHTKQSACTRFRFLARVAVRH